MRVFNHLNVSACKLCQTATQRGAHKTMEFLDHSNSVKNESLKWAERTWNFEPSHEEKDLKSNQNLKKKMNLEVRTKSAWQLFIGVDNGYLMSSCLKPGEILFYDTEIKELNPLTMGAL